MAFTQADLTLLIKAESAEFNKVTDQVAAKTAATSKKISGDSKKMGAATKGFGATASTAFGSVGTSLTAVGAGGSSAAQAFSVMGVAAKGLNASLGPIGIIIGVIALAIKALMSYFKGTTEGADALAKIMGVLRGIMTVLQDVMIAVGKAIYDAFTNPKEAVIKLWEAIKGYVVDKFNLLVDLFKFGWQAIANGAKGVGIAVASIFKKELRGEAEQYFKAMKDNLIDVGKTALDLSIAGDVIGVAIDGAGKAAERFNKTIGESTAISDKENLLWKKQNEFITKGAQLQREIADLRVEAGNRLLSNEDRQKAINDLQKVQNEYYSRRIELEQLEFEIKRDINALGKSGREDLDEEARLQAKLDETLAEKAKQNRFIVNTQATITEEVEREAEAQQKILDNLYKQEAIKADLAITASMDDFTAQLEQDIKDQLDAEPVFAEVQPISDTEAWARGWLSTFDLIKTQAGETFTGIGIETVNLGEIIKNTLITAVFQLADAFGALFAGQKKGFKEVVVTILKGAQQIIWALLATAIMAAIDGGVKQGGPILGLALAAIGIAGILALMTQMPAFGDGGYVDKPTLALIGEKGPEYIVPANKMNTGGAKLTLKQTAPLTFRLEGGDLYAGVQLQEILQNIG